MSTSRELAILKMFKLQGLNATGHTVQMHAYRYGQAEAHLAPDIRKLRSLSERAILAAMGNRGLTVVATREVI